MRIAICDDDTMFIELLITYLKEFYKRSNILSFPEIAVFPNGEALLNDKEDKDIIFLDVEMPGINGISVANELNRNHIHSILFIITSYSEYLDDAMRAHVFRYLSKPLEKQRLFRNLKDALYVYSISNSKLAIETKQNVVTVNTSDIIYIESLNRKVIVYTTSGEYESLKTMNDWILLLPENCFFQTHKSFIVNFAHVTDFDHNLIHLYHNQFKAFLTKRKYSAFKTSYLQYLESTR